MRLVDRDCVGGGSTGRRLGGLAADTWGLNVTLRAGFVVGVGRGDEGEGRRGVRSDAVVEDAMAARGMRVEWVNDRQSQDGGVSSHRT